MSALRPLGVSFSHRHAAWLGLDPTATLSTLIERVGVRHLRLSAYWDELAPETGRLDFAPLRPWLELAAQHDCRVLMTAGIRAQRHPEFYPPAWLLEHHPLPHGAALAEQPRLVALLLLMLERTVAFLADFDVIDAWQVENEPFLPAAGRTVGWRITPALLAKEVAVVRDADPRRRPIVINHSSRTVFDHRWRQALAAGDVLAQNIYTQRPAPAFWPGDYRNDYAFGPFSPALERQGATARRQGKRFWITELQAEPWEHVDPRTLPPSAAGSLTPARLLSNVRLGQRSGAERIYLWGGEWWVWAAEHHNDQRFLDLAGRLVSAAGAS